VFGRRSRCLYAVWSNPAPGVSPERFREYYEDVHRPDTLAIGHFERAFRYRAHGECRARYLTLWEAEYADLASALERVRKGALALREQGRIWPVQEVVFPVLFGARIRAGARVPRRDAHHCTRPLAHARRGQSACVGARGVARRHRARRPLCGALFLLQAANASSGSASEAAHGARWRSSGTAAQPVCRRSAHRTRSFHHRPTTGPEPSRALRRTGRAPRRWVVHWTPVH
jgi:hypothetical protein